MMNCKYKRRLGLLSLCLDIRFQICCPGWVWVRFRFGLGWGLDWRFSLDWSTGFARYRHWFRLMYCIRWLGKLSWSWLKPFISNLQYIGLVISIAQLANNVICIILAWKFKINWTIKKYWEWMVCRYNKSKLGPQIYFNNTFMVSIFNFHRAS